MALVFWLVFSLVTVAVSASGLSLYWAHRAHAARRRILDRYENHHPVHRAGP